MTAFALVIMLGYYGAHITVSGIETETECHRFAKRIRPDATPVRVPGSSGPVYICEPYTAARK